MSNTLLIAVNDNTLCNTLKTDLAETDYNIIISQNISEVVSIAQNTSPCPIIITKQCHSDMDGIKLLKKIKQISSDIEVIIITNYYGDPYFLNALESGASDCIVIPIKKEILKIVLKRGMEKISSATTFKNQAKNIENLQNKQILYKKLFNEVPCYISIQDKEYRLTETNKLFKKDFGDKPGAHCYEVYKHRTEQCFKCPVQETFMDGKSHHTEEIVTSKSGKQYNVLTLTSPIYDSLGEITHVMEMSTNITRLRKLQDNLTSLGLLLSSMSHGIRGILTALDGGIYRLEMGLKKNNPDQVMDACMVVKKMTDRIKKMMLNVLYYSKDRDLNMISVNIEKFAETIISIVEPRAKKYNIQFVNKIELISGFFKVDKEVLMPAIVNIIENSIDACRDDRTNKQEYKVSFIIKEKKDLIILDVYDNGMGIDQETRENMFTLFFSSKGHRGTGLGLFIANQIIKQHGGTIDVESTPGKGSHFRIELPIQTHADSLQS